MTKWLLIDTFGMEPPSVLGVGDAPKQMVPLRKFFKRGPSLTEVERVVADVTLTKLPVDRVGGRRRAIGRPLFSYRGDIHGVYVWIGPAEEDPPVPDPAGAWHFNLTTDVIGGSDDLLDLYGVAPELRRETRHTAEAFTRLLTNVDIAAALAKIVRSQPGEVHQAVWVVVRDDGDKRAAHFSFRAIAETNADGKTEVVLRGITHDLGPAATVPTAPPPILLEQRLLASMAETGQHRAIINLKTFRIMQWIDEPLPGLGWEMQDVNSLPWIHEDDVLTANQMADGLASKPKTEGKIRLRSSGGEWLRLSVAANLVLLDQNTTAAMLTMSRDS